MSNFLIVIFAGCFSQYKFKFFVFISWSVGVWTLQLFKNVCRHYQISFRYF